MKRTERVLASVLILGLAMLFVLTLVASRQFQSAEEYSDQAEHSRLILIAVQNLNRGLLNSETSQRGFLLTSKATYLDSYVKGIAATQAAMVDIAQRLNDSKDQHEQVVRLTALVQQKLAELQQTVNLEKVHHHPDALAMVQTDTGKDLMDEIQQINGTLLSNERERLRQRSAAIQMGIVSTIRLFNAAQIGMIVLFATAFFFVHRSLSSKRAVTAALQVSEAQLREKEHMLRTIADNLPVLISYTDNNEVVRFSNSTYKKWLNIDPVQALGRSLIDMMGTKMYEARREQIRKVLAGNPTEFQDVLDLPDGLRHHQISYIPDIASDGSVAGFFALTTDVTAMKTIERQLDQLARHDALTGLPNRRHFEEKLEEFFLHLRREPAPYAMLFLDIDHFKAINDTHGHAIGDATLKHFSSCLKASVRASDMVARLAGDEFVVLLKGLHNRQEAERITDNILQSVRFEFTVNGEAFRITTSIGIAYAPEATVSSATLFACADKALYSAKNAHRDGFRVIECNVIEMVEKPSPMHRS
jgi:diguanylate cyclase (GGDEF)-like protein/PAS domain S-box-containing protein